MKKKAIIFTLVLILAFTGAFATAKLFGANAAFNQKDIKEIEVDTDEYPLYLDEVPDRISDSSYIYAQLTKYGAVNENNEEAYDNFQLSLVDDDASKIKLRNAMAAAGLNPDENRCFAMKATLVKYDEDEGDYFVNRESTIKLLTPLSDNMYQYDEEENEDFVDPGALMIVSVNTSGRLVDISSQCKLVYADDILSAEMIITSEAIYGFILKGVAPDPDDPDYVEPGQNATPTPTKAPSNTTPTPTPTPTQGGANVPATPTPTQGGANVPATPTPTPANSSSNPSGTTKAPTQTPTKAPTKTPANSGTKTDVTPKTGDMHDSVLTIGGAVLAGAILVMVIRKYKKL
jgi:LPXTG-motif cell wall-anchored protein